MRTKPAYAVIDLDTSRINRVRQSWPELRPNEVLVRIAIEIPDRVLVDADTIVIEDSNAVRVAVAAEDLED